MTAKRDTDIFKTEPWLETLSERSDTKAVQHQLPQTLSGL